MNAGNWIELAAIGCWIMIPVIGMGIEKVRAVTAARRSNQPVKGK